jgi:hypothetical protein
MKTTLPDNVMTQISDITENKLKKNNIPFTRNDTVFDLKKEHQMKLMQFQSEATLELVESGVITPEMIEAEMKMFARG